MDDRNRKSNQLEGPRPRAPSGEHAAAPLDASNASETNLNASQITLVEDGSRRDLTSANTPYLRSHGSTTSLSTIVGDEDDAKSGDSDAHSEKLSTLPKPDSPTSPRPYNSHSRLTYLTRHHGNSSTASNLTLSSQITLIGRGNDVEKQITKNKAGLLYEKPLPPPPPTPTVKKVARGVGICTGLCFMTILVTASSLSVLFLLLSINSNLLAWPEHIPLKPIVRTGEYGANVPPSL